MVAKRNHPLRIGLALVISYSLSQVLVPVVSVKGHEDGRFGQQHPDNKDGNENHDDPLVIVNREYASRRELFNLEGRCAQQEPSPDEEAEEARVVEEFLEQQKRAHLRVGAEEEIVVDTWIHDIRAYVTPTISRRQIEDQMDVINEAFSGTGFRFELEGVTCTTNLRWWFSSIKSGAESQMKRNLRRGGAATLNVYLIGGANVLGWGTYPSQYRVNPTSDGVVIAAGTLPGGFVRVNYDRGKTLVHEIGHWLGLHHTFRGGCDDLDGVEDTPAQAGEIYGCPHERDSCPTKEGLDPVNNYMNYSPDACMEEFTYGQVERMREQWMAFRHHEYARHRRRATISTCF